MREGMEGRLMSEPIGGMTQGARAIMLIPTFVSKTGKYTYSLLLERSSSAEQNLIDGLS